MLVISSCHVNYSLSGASISPDVKTISIDYFPNRAPLASPLVSQMFTESIKDVFIAQTNLNLVESNGDLQLSGYIADYRTAPIAIQGNETAAMNRLTITVYVKFINTKDNKQDFETSFTRYSDYDSNQDLSVIENELISDINNQLSQDIFNKAVSNW